MLRRLNVERVPRKGSVAVLGEEAAVGDLKMRLGLTDLPLHPGSVPDTLDKSCPSFSFIFPISK